MSENTNQQGQPQVKGKWKPFIILGVIVIALALLFGVAKWIDNGIYVGQLKALKATSPNGEYLFVSWQPYNGATGYNDREPIKTGGAILMDGKFNFPAMKPGTQFNILSSAWKKFGNNKEGRTCLDSNATDTWTSGNVPFEIQDQKSNVKYVTLIGRSFLGANRVIDGYLVKSDDGTYKAYALGANRQVDVGKDLQVLGPNRQETFRWK